MKRSERLKPVVRFAGHKEDEAARRLGAAREQLLLQEGRLQDLEGYRAEYGQRFNAAAQGGMSAIQLRSFQAFMDKLDQAIRQQAAVIDRVRQDYEAKKRQWLAARNKTKAMETVVDRHRSTEQYAEDRRIQREQDDRSGRKTDKES